MESGHLHAIYINLSSWDNSVIYLNVSAKCLGRFITSIFCCTAVMWCGEYVTFDCSTKRSVVESGGFRFDKIYVFLIVVATPEGLASNFEGNNRYI